VRASLGGTMVVPGAESDPIQIIDVRDVADFIMHCLEHETFGIYNVTGPGRPLTMNQMVKEIREGTHSKAIPAWIPYDFLESHGVTDGQFPLYAPPTGEAAGLHRCNIARARDKGLAFRPLRETAEACFEWYRTLPPAIQQGVAPQFADHPGRKSWLDTEKELLDAWSQRAKK